MYFLKGVSELKIKALSKLFDYSRLCWVNALFIFGAPIFLVMLIYPTLVQYELNSRINNDFNLLENIIIKNALIPPNAKAFTIVKQLSWTCDDNDIKLLNSSELSPSTVRLIQIELANGDRCSNLSMMYINDNIRVKNFSNSSIGISITNDLNPFFRNFIFEISAGKNRLIGITNSTVFNDSLTTLCPNCYQVGILYDGFPLVSRGKQNMSTLHNDNSISKYIPSLDLTLTLLSDDNLYYLTKRKILTILISLSFFLSFLLGVYLWKKQQRSQSLDSMIRKGISNNEFIPYYQVIVDTKHNVIVGQEMLIRWQIGDRLIGPNKFIPYSEDSGLIIPMTELMLTQIKESMQSLQGWISVNIVAEHLEQDLLLRWFEKHADNNTQRLCFELTERKVVVDFHKATIGINLLSTQCQGFKLDDFGTGFGGFNYLQTLGIRSIKIDKMFIDTIGTSDLKGEVLDAIISFGHELNMEMIAEGVETQEQADYLNKKGVCLHQGYLYGRPMPLDELLELYNSFEMRNSRSPTLS
jgi:EAL domain-containing protein (putative c-di-GMP-specific phosphodiesterase class I)